MKHSSKYCTICRGQIFSRHVNPGNICDPCWLAIQQDDIEFELWQPTKSKKKQKEEQIWTGKT
jgi:hypothetical protein